MGSPDSPYWLVPYKSTHHRLPLLSFPLHSPQSLYLAGGSTDVLMDKACGFPKAELCLLPGLAVAGNQECPRHHRKVQQPQGGPGLPLPAVLVALGGKLRAADPWWFINLFHVIKATYKMKLTKAFKRMPSPREGVFLWLLEGETSPYVGSASPPTTQLSLPPHGLRDCPVTTSKAAALPITFAWPI